MLFRSRGKNKNKLGDISPVSHPSVRPSRPQNLIKPPSRDPYHVYIVWPCEGHCPNWESPLPGLRGTSPVCPWPFVPRGVVGVLGSSNLVGSYVDEASFTGSDTLFLQAGQFDDDTKSLSFCDPSSQPKLTLASSDIGHRWPCAAVCNFGPRYFSDNNAGLLNRRGSPTGPLKANLR